MCGLVGKLNFDGKPVFENEIRKMCRTITHRGPDDEGIWVKDNVGLGNRRLAIIDLSLTGHQPMSNEDKTVWLTFNGEIYNFLDLRKKLSKKGHRFFSHTDTEVIIHLWEEYGVDCLHFLRGMFAFALWDEKQRILFLARDRLGKKPLKYFINEKCFIFASELKAILKDKSVSKRPDIQAIDYFLTLESVPSPLTGFKGIKKLPAGCYILIKDSRLKIQKYWHLDFSEKINLSEEELKREIIRRLKEAVKLRLIADVPIGAFLSGGIDSSAIVALMTILGQRNINTFSIGSENKDYSEFDYARLVAKKFRTNHHEIILKPSSFSLLKKLAYFYEEPYGDPSALPTYLVSQAASQKLRVVLNGDGGDENFAGYGRYKKFRLLYYLHFLPQFLKRKIIKKFHLPDFERYVFDFISLNFPSLVKKEMYTRPFLREIDPLASERALLKQEKEKLPILDNILMLDFNFYLSEVLLPKIDIATMANGLECRSPLLDHKFIEFTAKIPFHFKLNSLNSKYIFKKALEKILPSEIIYRKKMGFGFPLGKWLRSEWRKDVEELLLSKNSLIRQYLKQTAIKEYLKNRPAGEHHDRRIWRMMMFEFWLQNFFGK